MLAPEVPRAPRTNVLFGRASQRFPDEGQSEAAVRSDIAASLAELQAIRELDIGPTSMHVVGTTCTSQPCCALVMCIYASEPWR